MNYQKKWLLSSCFAASLLSASAFAHESSGVASEETEIGQAGDANAVTRTIKVAMRDQMRFSPSHITVKQGETIRFAVANTGTVKHELMLGTALEIKEHNALMKKNPEMEHDEPSQVSVPPGGSGEIIWTFTKAGKVDFACLMPGHYDAGMRGQILVSAVKNRRTKGVPGTHAS